MTLTELQGQARIVKGLLGPRGVGCCPRGIVRCKVSGLGYVYLHWPDGADYPHNISERYAVELLAKMYPEKK